MTYFISIYDDFRGRHLYFRSMPAVPGGSRHDYVWVDSPTDATEYFTYAAAHSCKDAYIHSTHHTLLESSRIMTADEVTVTRVIEA